jgi:hypothetical protein
MIHETMILLVVQSTPMIQALYLIIILDVFVVLKFYNRLACQDISLNF